MGDCEKSKCFQEKRAFKRELLSWFKKVPYITGLELVAENLAGGCIKTLLFPFNEMEPTEPKDFGENDETLCVFCEGRDTPVDSEVTVTKIDLCLPSVSTSSTTTESPTKAKKKEPETFDPFKQLTSINSAEVSDVEGLNSFYNQLAMTSLLYQQHQHLQTAAMAAAVQEATAAMSDCHNGKQQGERRKDERPLDLTSTPLMGGANSEVFGSSMEIGELRIPEIRSKKKDRAMKKNYSDRELNAAVEAIKSGTIGTRRAAQLYGIPRSTLRNKVFKSAEMNRSLSDSLGLRDASSLTAELDKNGSEATKLGRSSPNSESETSTHAVSSNTARAKVDDADMAQYNNNFLRQLEEMRAKQNLNEQITAAAHNRLFSDMFNPLQLSSGYNPFLMPQYAGLAASPGYEYLNPYASSLMMPYLPELVKNLTQKRLELEQNQHLQVRTKPEVSPSSVKRETINRSNLADTDDIKVPEYKPAIGLPLNISSNLSSADTIKNAVTNSTKPPNFSASSYLQNLLPFQESPVIKKQANLDTQPSHKRPRCESSHSNDNANSSYSNGSTPMGKKRPKRGQYRKYDSELLAQAVRAVQQGEMSVHRAGTYYGVPHSTLEYKVKERHLLRKKKMAENSENKASSTLNSHKLSTTASNLICPYSSDSSQSAKCLDNSINSLNAEPVDQTDANSDDGNSSTVTPSVSENKFLDFSTPYEKFPEMSTPASELLKRLHERAQKRAAEIFNAQNNPKETESSQLIESLTN